MRETNQEMMKEINREIMQTILKEYPELVLDYCVLSGEYDGIASHQRAVQTAIKIFGMRENMICTCEHEKMNPRAVDSAEFFYFPDELWKKSSRGVTTMNPPTPLPYWFAFVEPPYGSDYSKADFVRVNETFFSAPEHLEVFRWEDNFSSYFDAGHEWWGAALWSIYDREKIRFVIIGASATD